MLTRSYAVLDLKAKCYGVPFFAPTDGLAIRAFAGLCEDARSTVAKYPEDFRLFWLGEFDDVLGVFTSPAAPVPLCSAFEFVKPEQFKAVLPVEGVHQ